MKLGVLLVHGIGDQGPEWADRIITCLERTLREQLAAILRRSPPSDITEASVITRAY